VEIASRPQERAEYTAHRMRQRLRILSAAEGLFIQLGIDRVSMLEITAACGFQPSTLYQYFKCKEDIVWAITKEILSDFQQRTNARLEEQMTAFEKVETLLELMSEDLELRPEKVRFMAQFDVLYARDLSTEFLLHLEQKVGIGSVRELRHWVKAGIKDGSMSLQLNPDTTLLAVLNGAIGTQRRLACLGSKVEQEYGQPVVTLFREAMRVTLFGLKAKPTAAGLNKASTTKPKSKNSQRRS
jgi:AcrR family transcriptional regulator